AQDWRGRAEILVRVPLCEHLEVRPSVVYPRYAVIVVFFFQAEDGIRERNVTGVQTCALPISPTNVPVTRLDPAAKRRTMRFDNPGSRSARFPPRRGGAPSNCAVQKI